MRPWSLPISQERVRGRCRGRPRRVRDCRPLRTGRVCFVYFLHPFVLTKTRDGPAVSRRECPKQTAVAARYVPSSRPSGPRRAYKCAGPTPIVDTIRPPLASSIPGNRYKPRHVERPIFTEHRHRRPPTLADDAVRNVRVAVARRDRGDGPAATVPVRRLRESGAGPVLSRAGGGVPGSRGVGGRRRAHGRPVGVRRLGGTPAGPVQQRARGSGAARGPLFRVHGTRAGRPVDEGRSVQGGGGGETPGKRHRRGGAVRGRGRQTGRVLRTAERATRLAGPAPGPAAAVRTAAAPAAGVRGHAAAAPAAVLPAAAARRARVRSAAQESGVRRPAGRVHRTQTRRDGQSRVAVDAAATAAAANAGRGPVESAVGNGTGGVRTGRTGGSGGAGRRQRPADRTSRSRGRGRMRRRQAPGRQTVGRRSRTPTGGRVRRRGRAAAVGVRRRTVASSSGESLQRPVRMTRRR